MQRRQGVSPVLGPPPRQRPRRVLPAGELGGPLAMRRRLSQERAVEHRALEPELHVAFPGEADSAVGFHRVAGDLHGAIRDVRLGDGGDALRLSLDVIEGAGSISTVMFAS